MDLKSKLKLPLSSYYRVTVFFIFQLISSPAILNYRPVITSLIAQIMPLGSKRYKVYFQESNYPPAIQISRISPPFLAELRNTRQDAIFLPYPN